MALTVEEGMSEAHLLFDQWLPLAYKVARVLWRDRYAHRFGRDEIESAALEGLWRGCLRIDPARTEQQKQDYLATRIRGSVSDWVRVQYPWGRCGSKAGMVPPLPLGEQEEPAYEHDPGRDLEVSDLLDRLLPVLKPAQDRAIRLRYFDGMTFRQIGRVMGKCEVMANKHVNNALARMRVVAEGMA